MFRTPAAVLTAAVTLITVTPVGFAQSTSDDSSSGTTSSGTTPFDTPPANSELAVDDAFDGPITDADWITNAGEWTVDGGVLIGKELDRDHHPAAARRKVETANAAYQLQFKLADDTRLFHVGFDPAKGELDKKGHLFSVVVSSKSITLMRHRDKRPEKKDRNETLSKIETPIASNQWHRLRITTWGKYVTVFLNDQKLTGEHPSFAIKKPTVVFRVAGGPVEIDQLKVWKQAGR